MPETYIFAHLLLKKECYSTLETMHKFSFWDYDMAGRSRSRLAFFLFSLLLLAACRDPLPVSTTVPTAHFRAFYHWQTEFALDSLELAWLDEMDADRLYVKFFDLDWDAGKGEVVPLASVELDTTRLQRRRIIPTLFITNRSMLQLSPSALPLLAQRIAAKIDGQFAGLDQELTEVQLDCDWTAKSRDN